MGVPASTRYVYVDGAGVGEKGEHEHELGRKRMILAGSMSGKEEPDLARGKGMAERGISLHLRGRGRVGGGDLD